MENIRIIKAGPEHFGELKTIAMQTFVETFAAVNTEANMQKYLSENFAAEKLGSEIKNRNSAFYLARADEEPVGYLKLNFGEAQTETAEMDAVEIERIYVGKEYYGKGLGQKLFDLAINVARERAGGFIWLGVWEKNERAIAFYLKNNFTQFDQHIFRLGDDVQTDIMMKLPLT